MQCPRRASTAQHGLASSPPSPGSERKLRGAHTAVARPRYQTDQEPKPSDEILARSLQRPSFGEAQPVLVGEAQPVFDERVVRRFTPAFELLRVDRAQVFAWASAQGSGEANQSIIRRRRGLHSPRSILPIG